MLRNLLMLVAAALLAALFIWAPCFAEDTAKLLESEAASAVDFAKEGDWEACEGAVNRLREILDERTMGLKILLDHEEVDNLFKNAAVSKTAVGQKDAEYLELEISAMRAALDYVRNIDKLSWINYL